MNLTTLPLCAITRISPLNPRHGGDDDVSQLAATIAAAGLQYPLIVRVRTDADDEYEVLDGGRRWRALKSIFGDQEPITVEILEGDEASARRAALAVSVTPRALHPVDEFEAFAKLDAAGFSIAQIARDFGLTEKHVRQRLALASLAPCGGAAGGKGEIARDAAEAFTTGPAEAQEALFLYWTSDHIANWKLGRPNEIRRALRGDDALGGADPRTIYLSKHPGALDAYLTAGGRVFEDLFEDGVAIRDEAIADRVVNEFLEREARRVAEREGWGEAFGAHDGDWIDYEPENLTEPERERLDALDEKIWDAEGEEKAALVAERDTALLSLTLRELGPDERKRLAVGAYLDFEGNVAISRGIVLGNVEETAREAGEEIEDEEDLDDQDDESNDDEFFADEEPDEKTRDPFAEPTKQLRAVIEAAVTEGLGNAIAGRTDIALMFAVAVMGCRYGVTGFASLGPVHAELDADCPELLKRISDMAFVDALAECASSPNCDLSVAFTKLVGQALRVTNAVSLKSIGALCGAARARGSNLVAAFDAALDRRGFFEAATKDQTLRIVAGLIGDGEASRCKKMSKADLAQYVATLSADKGHLPSPLADWAGLPELPDHDEPIIADAVQPLANAMAEAIEADEKPRKRARVKTSKKA